MLVTIFDCLIVSKYSLVHWLAYCILYQTTTKTRDWRFFHCTYLTSNVGPEPFTTIRYRLRSDPTELRDGTWNRRLLR